MKKLISLENNNYCPVCKSTRLDINGIFYECKDCGFIDDTTYSMLKILFKRK